MEALKKIIDVIDTDIKVHLPSYFKGKKVEVIILPLNNEQDKEASTATLPEHSCGKEKIDLSRETLYKDER